MLAKLYKSLSVVSGSGGEIAVGASPSVAGWGCALYRVTSSSCHCDVFLTIVASDQINTCTCDSGGHEPTMYFAV